MAKFELGQLVQLKSGGPVMTVEALNAFQADKYDCTWFAGDKHQQNTFSEAVLVSAEDADL